MMKANQNDHNQMWHNGKYMTTHIAECAGMLNNLHLETAIHHLVRKVKSSVTFKM